LDSLGYRRDVAMTMPHFSVAIQTLSKGGQILTLPYRVLEKMSRYVPIKVFKLPFDVDPFDVSIIWHEKTKNSQAHAWLRNQLYDLFE
jgi:DNA-binding transcriptional LysR family regulator